MGSTVNGTAGADTIRNSTNGTTINALGGNDSITDTGSATIIDGGDGDDRVAMTRSASTAFTMTFVGGSSVARVASDQTSIVNVEHLMLTTGAGDDTVTFSGLTYDSIWGGNSWDGGSGTNTAIIDFSASSADINASDTSATAFSFMSYGLGGTLLSLTNVQNLTIKLGSGYADINLQDSAGNNTIYGASAQTIIFTGRGNDVIYTVASDVYSTVDTGDGNDTIHGGDGDDNITPGAGDDWVDGGGGNNTVQYIATSGPVTVDLTKSGAQTIGGGQGVDTLLNIQNITASANDDILTGNAADNLIDGWGGSDTIYGNAGNDTLYGMANSVLDGGDGNDVLYNPAEGTVTMRGGDGDDNLYAFGNLSDGDIIDGGSGNDTLHISGGYLFSTPLANITGIETFILDAWGSYGFTTADVTVAAGAALKVDGSALQDTDTLSFDGRAETDGRFSLTGGAGADTLFGSAGDDTLLGQDGNDVLRGGIGTNMLDGGAGTDTAVFAGKPSDYFVTVSGDTTTVIGAGETDTLTNVEAMTFEGSGQTLSLAQFQTQSFGTLKALDYIASYKDLIGAFGDNAAWGAKHYFYNGLAEGRTITFNALNYLASYGDLIGAFGDNQLLGVEHYIKNGAAEGRKVSFDPLAYLCSYGDLIGAFGDNQTFAAEHYIKNGYSEGRKVTFDPLAYICSYGDLIGAFGDNKTAAEEHYIKNGYGEARKVTFSALNYIASYGDLIQAFGDDITAAEEHYIKNGYGEGRKVTFDPVAYLINNIDLGSCGFTATDVTEHYIRNGYWEHRTTNGAFGSEQSSHGLTVGSSVSDTLDSSGDQDWFGVSLTAGQAYTFTLSGADGSNGTLADPFLGLYDVHGLLVTSNNDAVGHDSKISFTATASGTFYLVASANDAGTGTYKLFGASAS